MKIAIVYSTRGGTTRECAELLGKELDNFDVELFELGKSQPEIDNFDMCIVGFPIRMGKAEKKARNYIKANCKKLMQTRAAYFMCCGFVDCFEEYAEKCLPSELSKAAVTVGCLGGSLDWTRFKGFDRMIVKAVRAEILGGGDNADQRDDMTLPTVMDENISQFATAVKKAFEKER